MKKMGTVLFLTSVFIVLVPAQAGHELPYYPSFYPQEIRLEVVDPDSAGTRLHSGSIHAYIGGEPLFKETLPDTIRSVELFGSYLVVTFNPAVEKLKERETRCAVARPMISTLTAGQTDIVFHPYPVTPYHRDYLHHFDLIEAAKQRYHARNQGSVSLPLTLHAKGRLAENLVQAIGPVVEEGDATVETIAVRDLLASHLLSINGWFGPPWLKEGWFHAYLLLAELVTDEGAKRILQSLYQRLVDGAYENQEEQLNLERQLVSLLTQRCERVVVGYTVRHEYFNAEFSAGVENIAFDSHMGFNSAIFLRTVKLKDFPWNGWLRLGVETAPDAAWNPIAGFTDEAGRLLWFAVGDSAFFPAPYNGNWIPNRIEDYQLTSW